MLNQSITNRFGRHLLTLLKRITLSVLSISLVLILVFILFTLIPLTAPLNQKDQADTIIINKVNIVDVVEGKVLDNKRVIIKSGFITKIEDSEYVDSHTNNKATIIDGKGQYLIPGLWDMHSHLAFNEAPQIAMPLYIANGVMYLRDMQGVMNIAQDRKTWALAIENHQLLGPRIIAAADHIVGDNYDTRNVEKVVLKAKENPTSFIKIYSQINQERYLKLATLANEHQVDFAGHYPLSFDPLIAINAGQRSIEHAHLFIDNASAKASVLLKYYQQRYSENTELTITRPTTTEMINTFEQSKFDLLTQAMVENNTYFVPTHVTKRYEAYSHYNEFLLDEKLKYIPFLLKNIWEGDAQGMKRHEPDSLNQYYERGLELTGLAHKKGVKILAGTDTYDPYSFPGFTLHTELQQLTKAGLSNAQALASATILPASYFGLGNKMGSVNVGKKADLILLGANPLTNIEHTQNIKVLIFDGAIYNQEDIKQQKQYVENNVSGISGMIMTTKMIVAMFQDNNPEARNAGY